MSEKCKSGGSSYGIEMFIIIILLWLVKCDISDNARENQKQLQEIKEAIIAK